MPLSLHTDYWADPAAKTAFQNFMRTVFHLDFTPWDRAGFWDDRYRPFSFFDGERVVSTVCLYAMELVVEGRPVQAGQISAMGSLPAWRRQGLGRQLAETALRWAREHGHEFIYLFSSDEALGFYPKLGFAPAEERTAVVRVRGREAQPGAHRLDSGKATDRELIHRHALARRPVSQQLGVRNDRLLMFHAMYGLRDCASFIQPLDLVVFARRQAGVVTLFDVMGEKVPPFDVLYPFIAEAGDTEVVFRFVPDSLGILDGRVPIAYRRLEGNNLHLSRDANLRTPFVFPHTAQA